MNEEYIKKIVKLKMDIAGKIMERLPAKTSDQVIRFGRLVLRGLEENLPITEEPVSKTSSNHIHIE